MFASELADCERAVSAAVTVSLSQSQFDALVSFAYNVGIGAFRSSTLLRKLNAGDYQGAADQFLLWDKNDGKVMRGLTRRRQAERALFLSVDAGLTETPQEAAPTAVDPAARTEPARPKMAPIVAALLPSLISLLPELGKLFGSGSAVAQRNLKAAERVAEAVVAATGAPNLQGAVERIESDPAALAKAREAVAPMVELVEAGGGGIAGARAYNVMVAPIPAWRMPAVWVSAALLGLVFMVVGTVLWAPGWSNDIRLQVVTAVLTIIGMVGSFWLGTSASSQRKTDIIANDQQRTA